MNGSPEGWECVECCPVRLLGEQSGRLRARGNTRPTIHADSSLFGSGHRGDDGKTNAGDSGTAARFFKTFSEEESLNLFTRTDTRAEVLEGDCLEVLRTMEDESVEAVVTDPPAGISFMGTEWDSNKGSRNNWIAWLTEVMEEVLGVTKPGGHALVWALPRTSHWTAMALEDAGWEVRDRVTHHFGSGFPKSANISKQIDKMAKANEETYRRIAAVAQLIRDHRQAKCMTRQEVSESVVGTPSGACWNWEHHQLPSVKLWDAIKNVLDIPDDYDALINGDRSQWIAAEREVVGKKNRNGKPPQFMWGNEDGQEWDVTAPATDAAKQWDGWGSALKPSTEDWWLCRKPLSESSIARNVLEHSTGGLNIDECRVPGVVEDPPRFKRGVSTDGSHEGWTRESHEHYVKGNPPHSQGRFPANLLLSHSPDCVRIGEKRKETVAAYECAEGCPVDELGKQSGELKTQNSRANPSAGSNDKGLFGVAKKQKNGPEYFGESGTAARFFQQFTPDTGAGFFYAPKASRAERNKGLEDMPPKIKTAIDEDTGEEYTYESKVGNSHPTVKSVKLMRYLVRLITPPGGTVLDCFAGSGSTGVAAVHEGFDFVGIEAEPEYAEIARRRIAHALENPEV